MSVPERLADAITGHTRIVLVVLLLLTALVGAGMPMVDDDSSLSQFESESDEAKALERINENFTSEQRENTTSVQLIVRGDNVLEKESLISSLEFQQEIRADESINSTLVENQSITGVENIVAISAIRGEQSAELNETRSQLQDGLNQTVGIQRQYEALNESYENDSINQSTYQARSAELEGQFDAVVENATANLTETQTAQYEASVERVREIESEQYEIRSQSENPNEDPEYQRLTAERNEAYQNGTAGVLEAEYAALQSEESPPLGEQIETLENMDDEEYERLLDRTLSGESADDNIAIAFMPSSYEPGSTQADTRMTSITQSTAGDGANGMGGGAISDEIIDSQLEIRELAETHEQDYLVFGGGVITDEINRSMGDSLAIVGPLAMLFVVVALLVAYRDPLDIVLGVAGIVAVLVWTFGFMGWADIAFNQMFVAVPVLLIGLSIDYAIHVFMRHREQRETQRVSDQQTGSEATREQREADGSGGTVRGSMTIALGGVGAALVWVTATTVIGFLSNLVSPIGPIREFGVVSSVGIVAALIVFGALIPAAKIEIDEFLESRGFDRRKRAFGTGGGRFSDVLTVGSTAARRIPLAVLLVVVLLTAGGAYGATQVDTSFQQEDFLAESPPAWTETLPGGMAPGEYHAKDDLEFVNQHFQREGSQAQLLVEGGVDDDEFLTRVNETRTDAADDDGIAYTLATGEADIQDPLSTMERTARQNESFNESFTAADTDDDGVPDENVSALYDQLYEIDEEAASQVLHRTDGGEYQSARMIVGVEGDATASETTRDADDGRRVRRRKQRSLECDRHRRSDRELHRRTGPVRHRPRESRDHARRGVPVPHRGLLADRCQRLAGCHHPASGRVLRQLDPGNDVPHRNALQRVDGDDHEPHRRARGRLQHPHQRTLQARTRAAGERLVGTTNDRHRHRRGAARQCRDHRRRLRDARLRDPPRAPAVRDHHRADDHLRVPGQRRRSPDAAGGVDAILRTGRLVRHVGCAVGNGGCERWRDSLGAG